MLFHLFSQHANGYVTFPSNVGPYTVSTQPGPGTAMDLCYDNGSSIDRGVRYSADPLRTNEFDVDAGDGTLNSNDKVTIKGPTNKYMTPREQRLTIDAPFAGHAQFKIRKLSGSPGARIRHGDLVALGAYQPFDPSRSPSAQRLRWLEANPDDNDPSTDPVKLGGLSMNPGGDSQRFRFFEGNLLLGEATLSTTDRIPPLETTASGTLKIRLAHEGLPNKSRVLVRFTSVDVGGFSFGVNATPVAPFGDAGTLPVEIPEGTREVSVPLKCVFPRAGSPCGRAAGLETRNLGSLTIVDSAMAEWSATNRHGTRPRTVGINMVRAMDYLQVSFGGIALTPDSDSIFHVAGAMPARLVVKSGAARLPPVLRGYALVASITPFPAQGFATTAATPIPTRPVAMDPRITFAADRSFTYTLDFDPLIPPGSGRLDLFCVTIDVVPLSPQRMVRGMQIPPRVRCQFGLIVGG